eukprot:scaffold1736_cov127-Cylindrotheca_fusiformis.AAC.62
MPMLKSFFVLGIILFVCSTVPPFVAGKEASDPGSQSVSQTPTAAVRPLPEKLIVGYSHICDEKAETAIRQGANVVIWSFMNLKPSSSSLGNQTQGLDYACIRNLIWKMDSEGYSDTVHLVSFGGWNGPQFNATFDTAEEWFTAWKEQVGSIFHGIDFDFEGNDDLSSPTNYFSKRTLDMMGNVSRLAKHDGYIVSIVPPQSYLDIHSTKFSQYVNLTDPDRTWHSDFSYFGENAYAYILAKYGDYIDLVMIQFYESYSRAAMEIMFHKVTPETYLSRYVQHLKTKNDQFFVDFESVPSLELKSQNVALPLSKMVWGFVNQRSSDISVAERHVYFPPECVQAAYQDLVDWMMEPKGFMFWCIANEGKDGVYYAKELNDILHIRSTT